MKWEVWVGGCENSAETAGIGDNLVWVYVLALPLLWDSASFSAFQICFLIGKMGFQEHISQGAQEA